MSVSNNFSSTSETICTSLDYEWSIYDGTQSTTRLFQVSFPNATVAVVNLILINAVDKASFPKSLKVLLKNDNVWFFGRQIGRDLIPFLDMVQFL